jgi:4-hydroxy-4-methyl-2-oxoglutarate aldolase
LINRRNWTPTMETCVTNGSSICFLNEKFLSGKTTVAPAIKSVVPEQAIFCGVALPVHCGPADNLAVMMSLPHVQKGDVIIAATDGYCETAVTGDLLIGMLRNLGAVGFVTDGCVRDLVGLKSVGLPAWSMGVTPNSPHRNGPGTIGMPVNIAGHVVRSGDIVVADLDGVVIIPQEMLATVLAKLPAIRAAEMAADESVRQGARLPDFLKT